jgi:HPt (histidine-containing phosphotransfer) domain-containing protein
MDRRFHNKLNHVFQWGHAEENPMTKYFIDMKELLERTENDRELIRDLLSIFREEFPQRHQALREAVASLDAPRVVLEAHTLKGMLSNLAAGEAAEAVAKLERLGRNKETAGLDESLAHFESIAKELSRQLEACVAEVSG